MCLDCGVGSCSSENSTICVCPASYSQSRELYRLPADYSCNFNDPDICLPCNVNDDALFALYLGTAVLDAVILFVFFWTEPNLRRIKRWCFFIACYSLSLIACLLRAADSTRLYGEDFAFTLIYTNSMACGITFVLLLTERFLRYIINSLRIYKTKTRRRKFLLAIIYSNWVMAAGFFAVAALPTVATFEPDSNAKADLIAASFLASGLALLYVDVCYNIICFKLLNDLERLIKGSATQQRKSLNLGKYIRAKKKIRIQRTALNLLFAPGAVVYSVSFFVEPLFEALKYLLPITSFVGAVLLLTLITRLKSFRKSAQSSQNTTRDFRDMSFSRLVTV